MHDARVRLRGLSVEVDGGQPVEGQYWCCDVFLDRDNVLCDADTRRKKSDPQLRQRSTPRSLLKSSCHGFSHSEVRLAFQRFACCRKWLDAAPAAASELVVFPLYPNCQLAGSQPFKSSMLISGSWKPSSVKNKVP